MSAKTMAERVALALVGEGGTVAVTHAMTERMALAVAHAMAECVRLKPEVHSVHGNEQMSRMGG